MKKHLLLALLLLTFGAKGFAQLTLTVADGMETNQFVPIYGLYTDAYLRCQVVYPAADLAGMTGGTITALTFYLSSPASASWSPADFHVRLADNYSGTTISTYSTATMTEVYSGSLDGTQSTMTVTFSTPFVYTGGNLLLEVTNETEGTYKDSFFWGVEATNASVQGYSYNDLQSVGTNTYNFIPKTTFTYIPGGSGPMCLDPTGLTVLGETTDGATISWTAPSAGDNPQSYQVCCLPATATFDAATANWVPATGTSHTFTGLATGTQYTAHARSVCGTDFYSNGNASVNFTPGVCAYTFNLVDSWGDGWNGAEIEVSVNGSVLTTLTLSGLSSTETLVLPDGGNIVLIWNSGSYDYEASFTLTDPHGVQLYECTDGSTLTDGEVFYTGTVSCAPVTCFPPTGLTASVTTDEATIGWTEVSGNREGYQAEWDGFVLQGFSGNPFSFTGLNPASSHTVRVRTVCAAGDTSDWSAPLAFTMDCLPLTTYPYVEGFENSTSIPACWRSIDGDGDGYEWVIRSMTGDARNPHTGDNIINSASFINYFGSLTPNNWLLSPSFTLPNPCNLSLVWYARSQDPAWPDALDVLLSTAGSDTTNFTTLVSSVDSVPGEYQQYIYPLANYAGQTVQFAFVHRNVSGMFEVNLDDVGVLEVPTVVTSDATNIDIYTASLNGSVTGQALTAIGFEWKASADSVYRRDTVVTGNQTGSISFNLANLDPATSYTFRTFAAVEGIVFYGDEKTFTTDQVPCPSPANLTVSNINPESATLTWASQLPTVGSYNVYLDNVLLTQPPVSALTYPLTGLNPGTSHEVRVATVCNGTEGASDTKTFSTPCIRERTFAIGDTNSTQKYYYLPLNTYYNYSYTQQLFLASEMGSANLITNIAFNYAYTTSFTMQNVKIYMGHTTKDVFASNTDTVPFSALTEVYSGNLSFSPGWNTFELDQPFAYNGNDNLVLALFDSDYGYPGSSYTFLCASAGDNLAIDYFSDSQIPNPVSLSSFTGSKYIRSYRNVVKFGYCDNSTCVSPTVNVGNVTAHDAEVSWTPGYQEDAWGMQYKGENDNDWTTVTLTSNSPNPYSLSNLTPNTAYALRMWSICSDSEVSDTTKKTFTTLVSCPAPTTLASTTVTATDATLKWTAVGTPGSFEVEYSDGQNTLYTLVNAVATTSEQTTTLTSLRANTTYTVRVRAICGVGDTSTWSNTASFTTLCGVEIAPYAEDFTGFKTKFSPCWNRYLGHASSTTTPTSDSLQPVSSGWIFSNVHVFGEDHARLNIYGTGIRYWLVTPAIDLSNLNNPELTFDLALTAYSSANPVSSATDQADDKFIVFVSTDNGATWSMSNATVWDNAGGDYVYNNISTTGEKISIPLSQYAGQTIKIAFYGESTVTGNGDNDVHIDNVSVNEVPTCPVPPTLSASNERADGATLTWTAAGTPDSFEVEYNDGENTHSTFVNAVATTSAQTTTLTGLSSNTAYTVRVRAICGVGDTSTWSGTASFTTLVSCPAPTALTATEAGRNSVKFTWTNGGQENQWEMEYGASGFTHGQGTVVPVGIKPFEVTGLAVGTTYDFYLRAVCGVGDTSDWSEVATVATLCNPIALPYTENFDSYTSDISSYPNCWYRHNTYSSKYPYPCISGSYSQSGYMDLYFTSSSSTYSMAVLPEFDLGNLSMSDLRVKFWMRSENVSNKIIVGVMSNPLDPSTFVPVDTVNNTAASTYEEQVVLLSNYTGTGRFVALKTLNTATYGAYIDDVTVDEIPTCPEVKDLAVSNVTTDGATLTWTGPSTTPSFTYKVEYSADGTDWTSTSVSGTQFNLTNLNTATMYLVRVFADCGSETGDTVGITFSTNCLRTTDLQIGDSTRTEYYLPVNTFYNYSYSQQLFLASEMEGSKVIKSIAFNYAYATATTKLTDVKIYMGHTTKNSFTSTSDYVFLSDLTEVYSGDLNCSQGWNTFDLDIPFSYNGNDNLVLAVFDNVYGYDGSSSKFVCASTEGNLTLCYYNDSYIPEITNLSNYMGYSYVRQYRNVVKFVYCDTRTCVPPTVSVNNVTANEAEVSWTPGYQESAWGLQYKKDGGSWSSTISLGGTANTYTLTNLDASTNYTVRMWSVCGNESSDTTEATFTTLIACPAPTDLVASNMTANGATLTWTANGTPNSFEIEYTEDSQNPATVSPQTVTVAAVATTSEQTATLTGLTTLTTYTARVRAICDASVSDWSNTVTFIPGSYNMGSTRTLTTCQAIIYDDGGRDGNYGDGRKDTLTIYPATQGNLIQVSGTLVAESANWDYLIIYDGDQVDADKQLLKTSQTTYTSTFQIPVVTSTTGPLTLYFQSDGLYNYPGFELNVTCVAPCEAPATVQASAVSHGQSVLTFGYDQQAQGINLELQYKATNATSWSSSISVQDITHTLTGLDNNTTYDVRVRSVCGNADAQYYSEWVNGTIDIACPAPSIPDATYYDYDATTVILSWDYTGSPTFNVMRVEGNNTTIIDMAYEDDPENYFADDLTPNTEYTFYVRSICNNGLDTSAWSNPITFTTPETCPTPINLTVSNETATGATLEWTANGTPNGFDVEYGPAGFVHGQGTSTTVPFTATTARQTTDLTGLSANTTYDVYVRAVCGNDHSDWSTLASFSTTQVLATLPYTQDWEDNAENTSWTFVNGTQTNQWTIGSATSNGGAQSLYVSNDDGSSNAYTNNSTSTVWAYRDIQFSDASAFQLSFDWKCNGEGTSTLWDYLGVYIGTPGDVTAGSTTTPSGAVEIGKYNLQSDDWQTVSIQLDGSQYSNTTKRLYLLWRNDNSGGSQPPAAVDNITITPVNCIPPTALTAEDVSTTEIMFSVNGTNNVQGYQVEYGATGFAQGQGTTIFESAASTPPTIIAISGLTANTTYDFYVRAICGAGDTSAWSPVTTEKTLCDAISTLPWTENFNTLTSGIPDCWNNNEGTITNASYRWNYYTTGQIVCVRFNSYNPTSGQTNMLKTPVLNLGSLTNPQLTFSYKNPTGGDFSVYLSTDGGTTYTTPIATGLTGVSSWTEVTYPLEVLLANVSDRSRVVIVFQGTSNWGNGDAYIYLDNVTVEGAPTCPAPTALTAEDVMATEIMFSVNGSGNVQGYQVEYGETGFTQGQGTIVYEQANATSQTLIVVDGLTANTTYDFYVRAICGVGDTSAWSSVTTETTACNVISTFPYTENFDAVATGTLPVCWTNTNDVGETDWEVSDNPHGSVGTHSGDNVMNFFQNSSGNQTSLQMPTFDLTSLTNPMLGFWYTNKAWAGDYDELNIYYRASSSDAWTQLVSYTTNMDTWTYDSLALPNPSATYQIKFEGLSNYGHGINLDDIVVKEMPVAGCFAPTDVAVSYITANSADVSWTDNANYTYELQYREANAGLQQVDTTFNFSQQGYSNAESLDGVTVNIDDNITFVASKNTGENEPKYYDTGSALRIYGGNKFVVTAANGAVITGVEIQAGSGSSNHPDMNYVVDNSQSQTSTASNAHYNVNNINAGTVTFTNPNTSGHLRMETLTIHYTLPGTESTWTAIVPATSPTTLDNLTPETDYEVRVRAICAVGDTSDWSNVVPFSTEEFICGAPVKLSVNDITMNSAEVVWSDDGTYPTELQYMANGTPDQSVDNTFDFSQQGYTNAQNLDGVTINIDNNIAFVANRHGGTAPAYYTSGSALRFYGKNNFVVTANNGVVITGIEIEAVDKTNINWSSDDGQTGSINANEPFDISPLTANTVTVTNPASSGHMKMKSLTVHYTILGTEGTWISMANVTSPVQLTGLMPNTNYSVRLRNICSASDTSVWTNTDFTTLGCQTITNNLTETACNSFTWDGTTYTTSGEYTKTYTLANGCDSVVTLNLTVNNSRTNTLTETACDSFTWDGTTYTTTGNYVKTYTAANGCDSVVTLNLTVNNSVTNTLTEVACDSFIWAGTTYTTTGNYVKTYMAANGCDSTVTLHLTVNNSVTNAITETACNSYTWAGTTYTTSGEYVKTFTAANGCDSTVTLNLTINTPRNISTTIVACGEYTWTEGTGQTYTVGGHYYYSHNDANGCTQVDTLHLTIQPATNVTILADHTDILLHESVTLTASGAAQYLWSTNEQTPVITVSPTATGNYTYSVTGKNVLGTCPTTAEITIHVDECMPARSTETIVACDSFAWHGTVYTASTNTPTYTIPNGAASGCDSIVTLHLTINNSVTNTITEVACDSFVWAGTTYTTSNDYVKTFTAVNGCDSVVTLHLTIHNTVTNSITEAACGSFVWDGTTYTASGDYVKTYTAANSCDSVVTLHLTINNPTHVAFTETACGSYTWVANNNTVYTQSGTYTYSHSDANGCTQVDTLHLTINAIPTVTVTGDDAIALYESATMTASGADTYVWNTGAQTATITVTPTVIGTAIYTVVGTTNNCVSEPATFNVVVGRCRPATYVETIVACDSYTWHGTTYTASTDTATYTVVDGAASGCDSIVTLHLTINNSVTNAINEVACDSYMWDGTTYTTSGDYVKTYTAANGCDSTVTLHLTINNSVTNAITEVACDSYTWNDSLYMVSGDYVQTLQTSAGCDSVVTLHLTVNNSVTSEFTENVCGSYTWNNVNYTQSGNYTQNFTAANGCDSTVTLHLTVRPIPQVYVSGTTAISRYQSTTLTAHGADSYLWNTQATTASITVTPLTSSSYSVVGTTDGCSSAPSIVTVYVGDCIPAQGTETVSACESYEWHGVTYTQSTTLANAPTYTIRSGAANGCDSVVSLVLTIYRPTHTASTITECNSYTWHGTAYTESGTYTYSHPDAHGCTQVDTLHLTIIKPQNLAYEVSSCGTYYWHNQPRRRTGTYLYTYADDNGCMKTDTLYLTVYTPVHQGYNVSACDSYEWFGHTYNRTGVYLYAHPDEHGCEQVDTLHLTINHSVAKEITDTGCGSFTWNNSVYTQSGNYTQTLTTAAGCDSVVTLHLTIYPVVTMNSITGDTLIHEYESATLVANATGATSYEWVDASTSQVVGTAASITVSPMTTTTYSVVASNGHCASPSMSITVRVLPCIPAQGVENVTACGSYEWHGVTYTQSTNTPTYTYERLGGCDSVVTLNLTINNPVANELTLAACDAYTWNNVEYTTSGDYTQTFTAANGCDSVVTLHLTINNAVAHEFSATGCGQYAWDNTVYNQSGDYVKTYTAANGCDSVVTLHLTIYPMPVITSVTGDTNIYEYESTTLTAQGMNVVEYTWVGQGVGQTLTVSPMQTTTYTVIGTSADQCVSTEYVVTVHVLPCIPAQGVENVTACGSYEWHGVTYTQSTTTPTYTYERQGVCDSIVTLHLTINNPAAEEFAAVECDAYMWNNVEYTQSGDYTQTFTAANGCDSVVTLHLTINNSVATEFSDTGCGQYVWDNTVYTQSGNYVKQYTTAAGCDSVVTLHLTIYPIAVITNVTGNTVIREYESATLTAHGVNVAEYTWVGQGVGQTITVSPMQTTTYTVIGTSANNCASAEYQVTVHVLPCVPVQSVENVTACGSYEWHGVTYTQSTNTPTYIFERLGGCDSVVTLHLTIYNPQNGSMNAQTCDDNYWWNGQNYTQSGTYTYEHQDDHGCTVVDTLHLTIMTPQHASLTASACGSYWWNGQNYTQSGTYTYSFVNQNGCTQVDTLHLTINQPAVYEFSAVACEEYAWGNSVYNHSGDYVKHFTTAAGCDSLVTLHLTINLPAFTEISATSCGSYTWNDEVYTQSGNYTQSFSTVAGCDSTVVLHLTIHNPQPRTYTAFNCGSYTWNGMTYMQSGTYTYEHPDQNGCTQVDTLHLTIGNPVATEFNATECVSYTWNNQVYYASGTYMQTLHTADGCDSVVTLHLTILNPDFTVVNETACNSYTWNGQTYTQSGRYMANLHNVNGCDSTVVLNLTVRYSITNDVYATACGDYVWNNVEYTQTGAYTQTFTAANGCDSVVTLHLTIHNPQHQSVTDSECGVYMWNNTLYTQSGTYTYAHLDQNGCMQVDTLHLTIYNPVNEIFTINACDSYTWFGTTYTQSGVYTHSHADAHGCTQIDTLNLTIYSTEPVVYNVDACGTYIWHGMFYTQSGTYTYRYFNNAGCEQTEVLNLTVHTPQHQSVTVSECGFYTWNNTVYTQSGTYTFAHFDNNGCTQVDTLHLTIYTPQHAAVTVTECNAYTWHNTLYTQSGVYTYQHADVHGCTQVDTLHLTILPAPVGHVVTVSECGSYTWYGQTYTQSGTYYHNFVNNSGCVGVDTLHLTIYTPQHTAITVVECESYIWNNTLYTQSGTYTYAHLDQNGCVQVDTLHLTLGQSQNIDLTMTECGSYTWHGQTYTQSGTYTYTLQGTAGCNHTETLHLIIFNPQHESFTAGDCNSYTWHGQTYTQSGNYYYSHLDANGCTQVDTLHLTIYNSQPQTFTVSECESYTWHGTTYTQSGTYTYTTFTANGCEQVETLHLTIHNPVHQSFTAEDCEYYTWHGVTYGQSGVYTYAHADNFGCMQVDTLHLTIHQPQHYDLHVADPGSSYTWNGVVYGQSGTYTQVLTDQFGCDSTVVLHLSLHTIGVEDYTLDGDVTVYPNPTRNRVTIGTTNMLSVEKLDIYDAYGKLLATVNVNDADAEVDLSTYAAGTYFIRITTDKGVVTKRVVKQQ